MREIEWNSRKVMLPENIGELTPEQYVNYCMLVMSYAETSYPGDSFRRTLLAVLADVPGFDLDLYTAALQEPLLRNIDATDGFLQPDPENQARMVPVISCCRNLLPEYAGFSGPGDWLHGLSFGAFVACVTELALFAAEGGDGDPQDRMARILYAVPDSVPVPPVLSFHAAHFFCSVWRAIQSGPVEINGREIDFRIIFRPSGPSRPDDRTGWTGVTFEVASANLFGTVADVERAPFWDVLLYLYKCKFEYLHEQKKSKK